MTEQTEDEMLAQAIAMSLEAAAQNSNSGNNTSTTTTHQPLVPTPLTATTTTSTAAAERGSIALGISDEASEIAQRIMSRDEPQESQKGPGAARDLPPAVMVAREWQPNNECLELIMGMGISENAARRALYNTGNDNAQLATSWVFENIDDPQLHAPFHPVQVSPVPSPGQLSVPQHGGGIVCHSYDQAMVGLPDNSDMFKMVFVVNSELGMGVGKIAAQVGHATLALYHLLQTQPNWKEECSTWENSASTKITLHGQSTHHLLELKHKAYEQRLPSIIVHDAGRTQVEPGSLTVFAVFGKVADVNVVTGKLKLL